MYRAFIVIVALIAAAAAAQTMNELKTGTGEVQTLVPDIPAGDDRMDRQPDPAAGRPAAKDLPHPAIGVNGGSGKSGAECRVRRADTDTGFVMVCEESDDG
jgi:hypothetical protein